MKSYKIFNEFRRRQKKEKGNKEQLGKIEDKYQHDQFKINHINNHIKGNWSNLSCL